MLRSILLVVLTTLAVASCNFVPPGTGQPRGATEITATPVIEQSPKLANHGCAPRNAVVGSNYRHADGRSIAIAEVLGQSPRCTDERPIAVKFTEK